MTDRELTIVVGAGAGVELGMPTGPALTKQIARVLTFEFDGGQLSSGDRTLHRALSELARSHNRVDEFNTAIDRVCRSMVQAPSIDAFIDMTESEDVATVGKLAIVSRILAAEGGSRLGSPGKFGRLQLDHDKVAKSWLGPTFHLITGGRRLGQLAERFRSVAVVVFNYDRCFEHFFINNLRDYYDIDEARAAELMGELDIYHPYGTVGKLPWQCRNAEGVEFGSGYSPSRLKEIARGIKTFTEGTDETDSAIVEIRRSVAKARRLLFLGFAYHELNLKLLQSPDGSDFEPPVDKFLYGTTYNISDFNVKRLYEPLARLNRMNPINTYLEPKTCQPFIEAFESGLRF